MEHEYRQISKIQMIKFHSLHFFSEVNDGQSFEEINLEMRNASGERNETS